MKSADLPLAYKTPDGWARGVLAKPLELLNDHAHLEKKAAANALEMLHRWPEPNPPENWVAAMTAVARDEVEHLAVVCRLLARREGKLTKQHRNEYAMALRNEVRVGQGTDDLVDRLIVSSLIEARSCERFWLLAQECEKAGSDDRELAKLYKGLWASEHGHYLSFLQLAQEVQVKAKVEKRWRELLEIESRVIQAQSTGPRMHSGI